MLPPLAPHTWMESILMWDWCVSFFPLPLSLVPNYGKCFFPRSFSPPHNLSIETNTPLKLGFITFDSKHHFFFFIRIYCSTFRWIYLNMNHFSIHSLVCKSILPNNSFKIIFVTTKLHAPKDPNPQLDMASGLIPTKYFWKKKSFKINISSKLT